MLVGVVLIPCNFKKNLYVSKNVENPEIGKINLLKKIDAVNKYKSCLVY